MAMSDYPLVWRVRKVRPEWFGRRCRILVHPGGRHGNRLIEFEDDGYRVVCPGTYLRRAEKTCRAPGPCPTRDMCSDFGECCWPEGPSA